MIFFQLANDFFRKFQTTSDKICLKWKNDFPKLVKVLEKKLDRVDKVLLSSLKDNIILSEGRNMNFSILYVLINSN